MDCPSGFACIDVIGVEGTEEKQCRPLGGTCEICLDQDDDGFGFGQDCLGFDCNDDDPTVFLGADEICDGIDNNCNGLIDENLEESEYWPDRDNDGFGSMTEASQMLCGISGWSSQNTDCNDFDSEIHPNATEHAGDGIDQNCDNQELCWIDQDNDNWRPIEDQTLLSDNLSCDGFGEASNNNPRGDCDDNEPNNFPENTEICDEIDNNCNDNIDENVQNVCGGCDILIGRPGEECALGRVYNCRGQNNIECGIQDFCLAQMDTCDPNATCTPAHVAPGYFCSCNTNFSGDGETCFSCYDGIQNGSETNIDCGPDCSAECPTFVTIPSQRFTMGALEEETESEPDERPVHVASIGRDFLIQTTEVTQGQWKAIMRSNPAHFVDCGEECPVEQISWFAALAYLNARSDYEGFEECYTLNGCAGDPTIGTYQCTEVIFAGLSCNGYRLPTEAEWEAAYRANTSFDTYFGDLSIYSCDSEDPVLTRIAWYCANGQEQTHAVARKNENQYGIFDLAGNVAEWIFDEYDEQIYAAQNHVDPIVENGNGLQVIRGGHFRANSSALRGAAREQLEPYVASSQVGFRPVRSLICPDAAHGSECAFSCSDNEKNGLESDIDCGGGICAPCATGNDCVLHGDCSSEICHSFDSPICLQEQRIVDPNGEENSYFGSAIAIYEDILVVGAPYDSEFGYRTGAVLIFRREENNWIFETKFVADDTAASDQFGISVALHGNYLLVGSHLSDIGNISDAGAAYIFRREENNWIQEAKLFLEDGNTFDVFGRTVALFNDCAIVGAISSNLNDTNNGGAAFAFRRNDEAQWIQEAILTGNDTASGDLFGQGLALHENLAIIGAIYDDDFATSGGAAYIFRYENYTWTQEAKLVANDATGSAFMGISVDIDENTAVVGAYQSDQERGAVYVFQNNENEWTLEQKIAPNFLVENHFGISVALNNEHILIGADRTDTSFENTGAAYLFEHNETQWTLLTRFLPTELALEMNFGNSLILTEKTAFIAARKDDVSYENDGSVYVFEW